MNYLGQLTPWWCDNQAQARSGLSCHNLFICFEIFKIYSDFILVFSLLVCSKYIILKFWIIWQMTIVTKKQLSLRKK